jgi:hypothetical protein
MNKFFSPVRQNILLALGVVSLQLLATRAQSATFSISPSTVSNTYAGYFTLQAGGLTNGEPIVVENYLDVDSNGRLDGNDMLMSFGRKPLFCQGKTA